MCTRPHWIEANCTVFATLLAIQSPLFRKPFPFPNPWFTVAFSDWSPVGVQVQATTGVALET